MRNGYFYIPPVQLFAAGFCVEGDKSGVYIWKFILPLYEPWKFLNLAFSERYPPEDNYVDLNQPKEDVVALAKEKAEVAIRVVSKIQTPGEFLKTALKNESPHPQVRRSIASTKLLLGKRDDAIKDYESIISANLNGDQDFLENTRLLLESAEKEQNTQQICCLSGREIQDRHLIFTNTPP